jgi:tryptophan synthase beta subunit
MNHDLVSDTKAVVLIANATYAADTTPVSVDLAGYGSCTILLSVGAGGITFSGTNKVEFVLTESDDNSTFTNVADADVIHSTLTVSNGIISNLIAAHASATAERIGYKGTKRYLKLLADFSGTHGTGTPIAATAILGHPLSGPVA